MQNIGEMKNYDWKVKVYLLSEFGNWNDCGTGILKIVSQINPSTEDESDFLQVIAKEDSLQEDLIKEVPYEKLIKIADKKIPDCVLSRKINKVNTYEKQKGN